MLLDWCTWVECPPAQIKLSGRHFRRWCADRVMVVLNGVMAAVIRARKDQLDYQGLELAFRLTDPFGLSSGHRFARRWSGPPPFGALGQAIGRSRHRSLDGFGGGRQKSSFYAIRQAVQAISVEAQDASRSGSRTLNNLQNAF